MRPGSCILCMLCLFASSPALRADEGKLSQVREAVWEKPEEPEECDEDTDCCDCDCDDEECDPIVIEALWWWLGSPFWVPYCALGDDFGYWLHFRRHPYAQGAPGYLFPRPWVDGKEVKHGLHFWSFRLTLEDGNDFSGLNRLGGELLIDSAARLGLDTGWNYFHEDLGDGRSDELVLGDVNFVFRFAQCQWAAFRTGLGFWTLSDRTNGTEYGFNFTYGADFFPKKPWIVTTSLDLGTLGEGTLVHFRGTVGALWRGCEIFTGYDIFHIGSTNLHGPMVGLRLWF